MANVAMTAPAQFDFKTNNIEVMNLATLQRTHKENDIFGQHGRTDVPAMIPQNGALAELLLTQNIIES